MSPPRHVALSLASPAVRPRRSTIAACLFVCAAVASGRIRAQDDGGVVTWAKLETAKETVEFKENIRRGGGIDAKARDFLEQVALPQLALEGNRGTITTVRKRLREHLLNEIADEKIGDEANRIFATFMTGMAAKEDEAPLVRVNAMLLVGELQTAGSAGRKPWPGAVGPMAKAAADTTLPKEVRIAAAVGLARHLDAAKANAELLGRISKDVSPHLASVVKEMAAAEGGAENDWLLSRCLSMLSVLGPAEPETVAELIKALESPSRSFDARVRAAATLAAVIGPQSNLADPPAVIGKIEELAIACLQRDADAAERLALEKLFGGGDAGLGASGPMAGGFAPTEPMMVAAPGFAPPGDPAAAGGFGFPGGPPGQPPAGQPIPTEVCRRAAWRMAALANAILTTDEKRGLRMLVQDDAAAAKAKSLAQNLRAAANELDTKPFGASLLQSLADLKPPPPPAEEGESSAAAKDDNPDDKPGKKPGDDSASKPAAPAAAPAAKPPAGAAAPAR